jgi:hypothetical protein
MRTVVTAISTLLLCGGTALAAQNVANTSQKGSLLIWPLINIDSAETLIEISNDANHTVKIECFYVNERKGRVDFDFHLTGKQTVSWTVGGRYGDQVAPAAFPLHGTFTGGVNGYPVTNPYRGELICFATNTAVTAQIAWNHLTGTATVTDSSGSFRYNAWSFVARNAAGLPERNNVRQGTPGRLDLTGAGAGTYDACPFYNIANFMPNGGALDGIQSISNALTVVSCNQDLRQDYDLHLTKLHFWTWNSFENSFTGAYICVDSVNTVALGAGNPYLVNGSNFDYSVLRTPNARLQVRGIASTQCPGSENAALLGVLASETNVGEVASTTHTAGAATGYVLWDLGLAPPFSKGKAK